MWLAFHNNYSHLVSVAIRMKNQREQWLILTRPSFANVNWKLNEPGDIGQKFSNAENPVESGVSLDGG